jgi:CRP-like cAMP-binding protein
METSGSLSQKNNLYPLVDFLNSVQPLSAGAQKLILRDSFPLKVEKKRFILKPGAVSQYFYFIVKGVVQGYIKDNGRAVTTWIMQENEIAGSFRTLGTDHPCDEYLQALEDCELIVIPVATTEYLFDHYPESNAIARRLWEFKYRQAEERAYLARISNATKRYNRFMEIFPGLADRISLKYIASHLGMTLETLSRIRSRQQKAEGQQTAEKTAR